MMNNFHNPVLLKECIEGLNINANGIYVDATFGGGGHSLEILKKIESGKVIAFDQDQDAILKNNIKDKRLVILNQNFKYLKNGLTSLGIDQIDGLIDFRMTSESICNLVRGFSEPYLGAHCIYKNKEIKVWEIELAICNLNNLEPGKVLDIIDNNIKVKTSNSAILIKKHSFETLPLKGTYII